MTSCVVYWPAVEAVDTPLPQAFHLRQRQARIIMNFIVHFVLNETLGPSREIDYWGAWAFDLAGQRGEVLVVQELVRGTDKLLSVEGLRVEHLTQGAPGQGVRG